MSRRKEVQRLLAATSSLPACEALKQSLEKFYKKEQGYSYQDYLSQIGLARTVLDELKGRLEAARTALESELKYRATIGGWITSWFAPPVDNVAAKQLLAGLNNWYSDWFIFPQMSDVTDTVKDGNLPLRLRVIESCLKLAFSLNDSHSLVATGLLRACGVFKASTQGGTDY